MNDDVKLRRWINKNRWIDHYELKYGVQPVEFSESEARVVLKAKCRFCEGFGRELVTASSAKRRKKRLPPKYFGPNFRSDNLESHLWREHPRKWHEYEQLEDEEKKNFFPAVLQEEENPKKKSRKKRNMYRALVETEAQHCQANMQEVQPLDQVPSDRLNQSSPVGESLVTKEKTTVEKTVENLLVWSPATAKHSRLGRKNAASSAVVEALDQLLGLRPADTTLQHFVLEYFRRENGDLQNIARQADILDTSTSGEMLDLVQLDENLLESLLLFFVDMFRAGLSVDASLAVAQAAHRLQPKLNPAVTLNDGASLTRMNVVRVVRHLMDRNLGFITILTADVWGYSLVLSFSMLEDDASDSFTQRCLLDVRLQFSLANQPQEVHLVTLPLSASQLNTSTAPSVGVAVAKVLCAIDSRGLEKLVGLTVDGDPFYMGGLALGVAHWLRSQAQLAVAASGAGNGSIAAFYIRPSATFMLSLAVEDALTACQREFGVISSITGIAATIDSIKELRDLLLRDTIPGIPYTRSSSKMPLQKTHWIRVYEQCEMLATYRETLTEWQCEHRNDVGVEHHTTALSSDVFWVFVFLLRDVLKDLQTTLILCVRESTRYYDVQRLLQEYLSQLRCKFNINTTSTASNKVPVSLLVPASTSFSYDDFVNAIIPLDLYMYEVFQLNTIEGIGDPERASIYKHFHALMVKLQLNMESASVSTTFSNSPVFENPSTAAESTDSPISFMDLQLDCSVKPPSTPYELMTLSNLSFMELLNGHQARLRARWSGKMLSQITDERNRLVNELTRRSSVYKAIMAKHQQQETGREAINEWRSVETEFPSLSSFAAVFGALLVVSKPATLILEEESLLPGSASALTLEAQLQALQLPKLTALMEKLDVTGA